MPCKYRSTEYWKAIYGLPASLDADKPITSKSNTACKIAWN